MKHALSSWQDMARTVADRHLFLCLDYDGTLSRIVRNPDQATLSPKIKRTLKAFSQSDRMSTAIISGRSLSDLKERVGLNHLIYAGNHGLEFEGPKIRFVHPKALALIKLLKQAARELECTFENAQGIIVENKGLTLSVHYRKLNPKRLSEAEAAFRSVLQPYLRCSLLTTTEGKKVWEVRPLVKWNKGTTVLWLLGRLEGHLGRNVYAIYIGDDQTDEDAFKVIKQKGLGIKVTRNKNELSEATYYLSSIQEVSHFLMRLKTLKTATHSYAFAGKN